jgi:hypothetical protein
MHRRFVAEPMERHAIRFFAGSYGHSACRSSCFARRDAERFGIAHSGRDSVRNFKKMQLTLDPRTVSFASQVMDPIAKLVM